MIFSNNILYDFILVNLLYLCVVYMLSVVIHIFIFYFEITKHLEGIFIVFATEVSSLFKLFYSKLHIYSAYIYLSIHFLKKKLIRHWSFWCKREQKENKKFINKRKYSNEKPRENLWKLSRTFFFENILRFYTYMKIKWQDFTRNVCWVFLLCVWKMTLKFSF